MKSRPRILKDVDQTLVAASALVLAGLIVLGVPPYWLLGM
jgi:hypothetical protein